jgi:hypothetical protein
MQCGSGWSNGTGGCWPCWASTRVTRRYRLAELPQRGPRIAHHEPWPGQPFSEAAFDPLDQTILGYVNTPPPQSVGPEPVRQETFVRHRASVDFVVYNRVTNHPLLAIEVDGFAFHENNPAQLKRDTLKDEILRSTRCLCCDWRPRVAVRTNEFGRHWTPPKNTGPRFRVGDLPRHPPSVASMAFGAWSVVDHDGCSETLVL